jgi:hypothetical protein
MLQEQFSGSCPREDLLEVDTNHHSLRERYRGKLAGYSRNNALKVDQSVPLRACEANPGRQILRTRLQLPNI